MRVRLKGLNSKRKRLADGSFKTYWYAWKGGPSLRGDPGTPEFMASYNEADLEVIRETTTLTMTVPEVRARAMDEFGRTITVISEALAKRAGRPADDLAVRTVAGAIIGVIMSITMPWEDWSSDRQAIVDMFERIDQALGLLEDGLPL